MSSAASTRACPAASSRRTCAASSRPSCSDGSAGAGQTSIWAPSLTTRPSPYTETAGTERKAAPGCRKPPARTTCSTSPSGAADPAASASSSVAAPWPHETVPAATRASSGSRASTRREVVMAV